MNPLSSPRCAAAAVLMLVAAFGASHAIAQDVVIPETWGFEIQPQQVAPGPRPFMPQPPPGVLNQESPNHEFAIPPGPARPGPDTPPSVDTFPDAMIDTGQFRYFQNQIVTPGSLTTSSRTPEPANGILQDTVFQTGNWYASISPDNGETWNAVSPYSFFPSASAGFCCDQQCINVPTHGILVWLLQYNANAAGNTYRFAVANSRNKLRSGNASDWYYYDFTAQSFGFAAGAWLDYPDIAYDGRWLHCSANVFGTASGSVRWRMELVDLRDHTGLTWSYSTNATLLGSSYRFAKGISGAGKMMYGCHKSTSEFYVFQIDETTGSNVRTTISVGSWANTTGSCPGPDNIDWCGRAVGGVRGAWGNTTEVGFMWTANTNGGSRPHPYTRIVRARVSDRTKIAEHDLWNGSYAYAYADGMSNSLGHIGCVVAVGGGPLYPHVSGFIIDQYQAWNTGITTFASASGNSGPNQNRFGDYFTVRRHPTQTRTFIGNGSNQNGGTAHSQAEPRFLWFGRDDYEPTWVNLTVQSTPITGVPITQDVKDLSGLKNGSTNYTRRFAPSQGYSLTAPATRTVGSTVYAFERWAYKSTPTSSFSLQPIGQTTLTLSSISTADDTAEARYLVRRTLSVQSTNPSSGISITVSPSDINGSGNGSTSFTRYYRNGEVVSLTAPASVGFNDFRRWVVNGVVQRGNPINASMTTTRTAVAEYWNNQAGAAKTIGAGCRGSSGVPVQTITWPGGQQGPQQGTATRYNLSNARANTAAVLHIGISNTVWNGLPLPLRLDIIGMTGCVLYHDLIVSPSLTTNGSGATSLPIVWPVAAATVGASIYTTYAVVDIGANRLGVVHSNAMVTVVGGNLP